MYTVRKIYFAFLIVSHVCICLFAFVLSLRIVNLNFMLFRNHLEIHLFIFSLLLIYKAVFTISDVKSMK